LADIFVHPSVDEGFALAPLEAMACAKPVIITDGYSSPEAVDNGFNGFLCKANSLKDWTTKIRKLVKNEALRKKMGDVSFERIKKEFRWDQVVTKHLEVFWQLLK